MKKILVATDYSDAANNAVEFAANLAYDTNAELILFNVYKLSGHASNALSTSTHFDELRVQNLEKLDALAQQIVHRHSVEVRCELGEDDTIDSLRQYTDSHNVDLVVMGIESDLTEYKMFGNTTTAAIKLMQFPLLVVPNDVHYGGIGKIMYACETSYLKEGCKLDTLKDFVRSFEARLEVFHVLSSTSESDQTDELEDFVNGILQGVEHTFQYEVNRKVGDGIRSGLEKNPADLLVMVPHKMGFFESLFKGSNTSQMTVKTHVPLLVLPNEAAC